LNLCPTAPARAAESARQQAEEQMDFGIAMARRGLWSEALFRFRQADLKDPGNPAILNNLAVASEAVGLFDEALGFYQKALKLAPSERDLKRNYARFVEFYQAFKPEEEVEENEDQQAVDDGPPADDSAPEAVGEGA
jgi:Flp pilus assembly protein TadD